MGRDQGNDGDDTAGRGKKGRRGSKKLSGGGLKGEPAVRQGFRGVEGIKSLAAVRACSDKE
jgi:hypothetical protein